MFGFKLFHRRSFDVVLFAPQMPTLGLLRCH
jgi:hypothetical protein